jgi:recombinational DNA repair protein RecT
MSKNRYVYIGAEIYEFKTASGDEIVKYVSNVGNSNVPYPYAIGKKYIYIMLDKVFVDKSKFTKEDMGDVYRVYYDKMAKKPDQIAGKMTICKLVQKRLGW